MTGKVLLVLKEQPSFEGELSISLIEEHDSEGRAKHSIVCQKKPPLNENEFAIIAEMFGGVFGEDLGEITKSIDWQQEVPPLEAKRIMAILEHQVVSVTPERVLGLDGTIYELLIERGLNKVQFTWWCAPPAEWKALGVLSKILLERAATASMIEAQQSNNRKRLVQQLREELVEAQAEVRYERTELLRKHNVQCHELAQLLRTAGLTCPGCGVHSSDIRFFDKSPPAKSYFICGTCGRSFRPEDL